MSNVKRTSGLKGRLIGPSILALGVMLSPGYAFAQAAQTTDTTTPPKDGTVKEVVITGVRNSLKTAQQIKRSSDTIVDSITATDIGEFPDKSVAEALQRVAGITVNRFAASSDTSHFSAEPSGVLVRGLQQVRSEFNGRDSFSANSSRGLDWGDISPELMAGVDAYKNATSELIEGGIAGSINMRTLVPFDSPGQLISTTFNANYGDLSGKTTPDISGIYSNRWQTPIGEFGFMVDGAFSKVQTISQGIQYTRMGAYQDVYPGQGDKIDYIPSQVDMRDTTYDRDRKGIAMAGQWRSPDHKFLLTAQYNESSYSNVWHEHAIETAPADIVYGECAHQILTPSPSNGATNAVGCNTNGPTYYPSTSAPSITQINNAQGQAIPIFNSQGLFQAGAMTDPIGWWGSNNTQSAGFAQNANGQQMVNACYGWNGCNPAQRGPDFYTATRLNENREFTADTSINLKWDPTDRLHFNFDVQQVHSAVKNYDIEVDTASWANVAVNATGNLPTIALSNPTNVNVTGASPLSNPDNYYYRSVMDHLENSGGDEWAARGDMRWDIKNDWLDSLKVGFRYADREQTVRWSGYNWANIANEWTGCDQSQYFNISNHTPTSLNSAACGGPSTFAGYPQNNTSTWSFPSNFMGGGVMSPSTYLFTNYNLIQNQQILAKALGAPTLGVGSWDPLCSNTGTRNVELPGTCFTQAETDKISEKTEAGYFMLKFGGPGLKAGNFPVSGNFGVRYVRTEDESGGGISIPGFQATQLLCQAYTPPPGTPAGTFVPKTPGCYLSAADKAFFSASSLASTRGQSFGNVLPSFNIKMDLNSQWLVRFAASQAMSRPDVGLLKNYLGVGASLPSNLSPNDPHWIKDSSGNVVGVSPAYSGTADNPLLKPTIADQMDFSIEHYFGNPGSLTLDLFYKQFHDYIQNGVFDVNVTNNGVSRAAQFTGPQNMDGGRVKGFELAYQRFFTFLPGPLNGLGVQSNFTYVDMKGVSNSHLSIVGTPGTTNAGVPDYIKVDALEGLSKTSYNVIGMYEKGPLSMRLAYNWRDKWLVTALDCCVYLPVWQMASGYLDGSIHYKLTQHIELDFAATNILNTMTVLKQQVTDSDKGGLLMPNAWFQQDRRFQAGFRLKY